MRVLHVLAPAPHGGLERVVQMLSLSQREAGADVSVLGVVSPGGAHPFFDAFDGTPVRATPLPIPNRSWRSEVRAMEAAFREIEPTIVHTHGYRSDVLGGAAARRVRLPHVATAHGFTGGSRKNRLYEWVQVASYRRWGHVVAVSRPLAHRLADAGVPSERLHVVRNAWRPTAALEGRDDARRALGLPADGIVVGWVGRLEPEKGPELMLRALQGLPDVTLCMVGGGSMERELRRVAEAAGLTGRVRWTGWLAEAGRYLPAFDVLALSSLTEGTPIILLEALAAEVPIVATDVGGVPDVVRDEREALLVAPGDAEALVRAVQACVRDAAATSGRVRAGVERLGTEFGVERWVQAYETVYRKARGEAA